MRTSARVGSVAGEIEPSTSRIHVKSRMVAPVSSVGVCSPFPSYNVLDGSKIKSSFAHSIKSRRVLH